MRPNTVCQTSPKLPLFVQKSHKQSVRFAAGPGTADTIHVYCVRIPQEWLLTTPYYLTIISPAILTFYLVPPV